MGALNRYQNVQVQHKDGSFSALPATNVAAYATYCSYYYTNDPAELNLINRMTLKEPLPGYLTGSPEVQPWSGAY